MPLAFFARQSSSAISNRFIFKHSELPAKRLEPAMNSIKSVADGMTGRVSQHSPTLIATRAELDVSAAQGNAWHWHLTLIRVNVGFTMASSDFRCKASSSPVGIVVLKLVDEGKLLNQVVPLPSSSLCCGWSPLKEIKGDRGQFTVQYLLQHRWRQ